MTEFTFSPEEIRMEWADYKAKVKEALEKSKFDVAETTLLQALQWVKDTGGSNERLCLCLDQLAWIYVNIKDLDRAATCYKESLEIKGNILGEQNPIVARACKKLATVVYMQKRYDLAEKYSKDALNIFKQTLGVEHEETQQTLSDLVSLLRKMNRNIEANILQNMGKQATASQSPQAVEQTQRGYSTSQTFLRIKVCSNCGLPFDGDFCMRCTEGRVMAHHSSAQPEAQSNVRTGEQNIQPMMQNLLDQQIHQEKLFPQPNQAPQGNQQQQPNPDRRQSQQNPQQFPQQQPPQFQNQEQQNLPPQGHQQSHSQPQNQPSPDHQQQNPEPQNQAQQQTPQPPTNDQGQNQQLNPQHQQPEDQSQRPPSQSKPQNVLALLQQQNQQQQAPPSPQNDDQMRTFPNLQQQHQNDLLQALEQHDQHQLQRDRMHQQPHQQQQAPAPAQSVQEPQQNYQKSQTQTDAPQPRAQPTAGQPEQSQLGQNPAATNVPLPAAPPSFPGAPPSLVSSQPAGQNPQAGSPQGFPQPPVPAYQQFPNSQPLGTTGGFQQIPDPTFQPVTGNQPLGTTGGFQQTPDPTFQPVAGNQSLGTTGGFQIPNASSFAGMNTTSNLPDARNLETTGGFQQVPDAGNDQSSDQNNDSGMQINLDLFPMPESLSATGGFMPVTRKSDKNAGASDDPNQQPQDQRHNPPPSNDQQQ